MSGLTSAYLLSKDPANTITVVAKHMPGDYDIEYASPWAGANVLPYVDPPWSLTERCVDASKECPSIHRPRFNGNVRHGMS